MKNLLVAVSGGIDSVVLLDKMAKRSDAKIIVAHFDHGIRDESTADARFVEALAKKYRLPFVSERVDLGKNASEDMARQARYKFLRQQSQKFNAQIVTAHHADDLVETVAINILRGTGWRGLAVFGASDVLRPLVNQTKSQLYDYAIDNRLEWVEDATNATDVYLRNRLRGRSPEDVYSKIISLWMAQRLAKKQIDKEVARFSKRRDRYFFIMLPRKVALEILRTMLGGKTSAQIPRPHAERALLVIKTARSGTFHDVDAKTKLNLRTKDFSVIDTSEKML